VDHLDGGAGVDQLRTGRAEEVSREDDERRPDALPGGQKRLADRGRERVEGIGLPCGRREEVREARVDGLAHLPKQVRKRRAQPKLARASFSLV
jgi:hypothetical protein